MSKLIKFNQPNDHVYQGRTVYVNPEYVVSMMTNYYGNVEILTTEGLVVVDGSSANVAEKLNGNKNE